MDINDTVRRNKGEFFTPTPFVDLAHKYISDTFGEDWKERFIVWDCAWGLGNLTRDYKFRELYCSTLEQSDIDTALQLGTNPEATKFQFDFLNDLDSKLPQGLQDAINIGKEILFLINPPYATANNMGTEENDSKAGVATTITSNNMKADKWGASTQNLYAQFLYRISKYQETNKNIRISLFCPPLFLTGSSYKEFRSKFLKLFGFEKAFLFQASHFSNVSTQWGISFSIWNKSNNTIKDNFIHDIIEFNENLELEKNDNKIIYNLDNGIEASKWVREETKGLKTFDALQLGSAMIVKPNGRGTIVKDSLGYLHNNANNTYQNITGVCIYTSTFSGANGLSIIPSNFFKVNNLFCARKCITGQYANWINDKDEYLAPNETHIKYQQFTYDSIVYSLFNNSSQQSSLRQVDYKNKKWDIKNEFFWLSKDFMIKLANENNYDELYRDAKLSSERFVYTKLFGPEDIYIKLSPLAKEVLDMATALLVKSIKTRKILSEEHPEYHLNSWDAGYAQLKLVWKEYHAEEFKEFRQKYKELEDNLRPLIYELGFLK